MDTTSDRIERKIFLKAPRARVWRALTDAAEFGSWFGVDFTGQAFVAGKPMQGKITYPGYSHLVMEVVIERIVPERMSVMALAPCRYRSCRRLFPRAHHAGRVRAPRSRGRHVAYRRGIRTGKNSARPSCDRISHEQLGLGRTDARTSESMSPTRAKAAAKKRSLEVSRRFSRPWAMRCACASSPPYVSAAQCRSRS